jgi:hypothetical protein
VICDIIDVTRCGASILRLRAIHYDLTAEPENRGFTLLSSNDLTIKNGRYAFRPRWSSIWSRLGNGIAPITSPRASSPRLTKT